MGCNKIKSSKMGKELQSLTLPFQKTFPSTSKNNAENSPGKEQSRDLLVLLQSQAHHLYWKGLSDSETQPA